MNAVALIYCKWKTYEFTIYKSVPLEFCNATTKEMRQQKRALLTLTNNQLNFMDDLCIDKRNRY